MCDPELVYVLDIVVAGERRSSESFQSAIETLTIHPGPTSVHIAQQVDATPETLRIVLMFDDEADARSYETGPVVGEAIGTLTELVDRIETGYWEPSAVALAGDSASIISDDHCDCR